jgi:preprotein translocase subunit YajC
VNYGLLVLVVILAAGAFLFSRRSKQRMAAKESLQRSSISFGTEVMTTSGLYGTVVGINDDDTVQLSIAPGIEVKWAFAALRDAASLPARYRGPISDQSSDAPTEDENGASGHDS